MTIVSDWRRTHTCGELNAKNEKSDGGAERLGA